MTPVHFSVAYWCLLVAALLPFVCAGIAKSGRFGTARSQGGYDNNNPRAWLAQQDDWRARANAAQANSFEALPFFIGALVVAHQLAAPQTLLDLLAIGFVALRVLYIYLYLVNRAALRSVVWSLGLAVNIAIVFCGAR